MVTERQQQIFDFIKSYMQKNSLAPTYREIGEHFKFNSSAAMNFVSVLVKKGLLIIRHEKESRSIQIKGDPFILLSDAISRFKKEN